MVGAHLTGQPLNHELTGIGATLIKSCRTAAAYRLFALRDATLAKPGLVREREYGPGIELEVWAIPEDRFGSFVAAVHPTVGDRASSSIPASG